MAAMVSNHQTKLLPPEIIIEIILRLPIKAMIKFTSVSKFWRTLISNPFVTKLDPSYFVLFYEDSTRFIILDHNHNHDESLGYCFGRDQMILLKPALPDEPDKPPAGAYPYFGRAGVVPVKPASPGPARIVFLASCNGMILFSRELPDTTHVYTYIHMCNPVTGESVAVPEHSLTLFESVYAFGFCPVYDRYKLLRMVLKPGTTVEVEIYTVGGNQRWRKLGSGPAREWYDTAWRDPVCAGGVLHWLPNTTSITTFCLAEEEFGETPPPPLGHDEEVWKLGSMDLHDQHCLIATVGVDYLVGSGSEMGVWVRKDGFWSKNWVVIDDTTWLGRTRSWRYGLRFAEPVAVTGDGRILMIFGDRELYSYDPKTTRGVGFVIGTTRHFGHSCWMGLVRHRASLVSPRYLMKDAREY